MLNGEDEEEELEEKKRSEWPPDISRWQAQSRMRVAQSVQRKRWRQHSDTSVQRIVFTQSVIEPLACVVNENWLAGDISVDTRSPPPTQLRVILIRWWGENEFLLKSIDRTQKIINIKKRIIWNYISLRGEKDVQVDKFKNTFTWK